MCLSPALVAGIWLPHGLPRSLDAALLLLDQWAPTLSLRDESRSLGVLFLRNTEVWGGAVVGGMGRQGKVECLAVILLLAWERTRGPPSRCSVHSYHCRIGLGLMTVLRHRNGSIALSRTP